MGRDNILWAATGVSQATDNTRSAVETRKCHQALRLVAEYAEAPSNDGKLLGISRLVMRLGLHAAPHIRHYDSSRVYCPTSSKFRIRSL